MLSSGDHGLSWPPFLASYLPIFTVTEPRKEYKTGIHAVPLTHQERNATDFPGEPGTSPSPGLCVYSTDSAPPSFLSSSALPWRRPEVGQGDMKGTFFFQTTFFTQFGVRGCVSTHSFCASVGSRIYPACTRALEKFSKSDRGSSAQR